MTAISLRTKLFGMAVVSLVSILAPIEIYDSVAQATTIEHVRGTVEALTQAMEVSVQQLGQTSQPDEALLRDYVRRLGPSGVHQITVLNPEREPVAESAGHAFLIEQAEPGSPQSSFDLLVPIVIGASKLGYVRLKMSSQTLESRLSSLRRERWAIAGAVFCLALSFAWLLARQIARPVESLRVAATRIQSGEFEVELPKPPRDEIGALVLAFREMLRGLKERDALRADLESKEREAMLGRVAASVAHDVRNPLNYLSLSVDHLVSRAASEEAERIGAQMRAQIHRASGRISDLLNLGKAVVLSPTKLDVSKLLTSVAEASETPQNPVEKNWPELGTARWDSEVVEGILRNLLTNAIQASSEGQSICLRAELREDEQIAIHVEDRGQGLSPEILGQLFEPYVSTKPDGVGMGLAIASRGAKAHGGSLKGANRDGGGACFTLTLPRICPEAES